jgi:hypothetical protein
MNPAVGGMTYQGAEVHFSTAAGLGIETLKI